MVLREDDRKDSSSSSSAATVSLELPVELPSVEEALKTSAASVKVLDSDLFLKRRSLKKTVFLLLLSPFVFFPALICCLGQGGVEPISEHPCACFCFLLDRHLEIEAEFHTASSSIAGFHRNDGLLDVSKLG